MKIIELDKFLVAGRTEPISVPVDKIMTIKDFKPIKSPMVGATVTLVNGETFNVAQTRQEVVSLMEK